MLRRQFLLALPAVGLTVPRKTVAAANPETVPMRALGARCGLQIGAQAMRPQLTDVNFRSFLVRNFSSLTAGIELKWHHLRPDPDTFNFGDSDWMVEFAGNNGLTFRGHNLCWNVANPNWMGRVLTAANAERYLTQHISTVVGRYKGRIGSWDVVNEPQSVSSTRSDALTSGLWLDLLGPKYIDIAFHAAADADPGALRVLNIYQVELDGGRSAALRESTLQLVEGLLSRKVPIQAIGLQSHVSASLSMRSAGRNEFISKLRTMGMQIQITELDVNDTSLPASLPERDEAVANCYRDYLSDVIEASQTKSVTFWTPWDRDNWYDSTHGPYFDRHDGERHRPGLLAEDGSPKKALAAVTAALRQSCGS